MKSSASILFILILILTLTVGAADSPPRLGISFGVTGSKCRCVTSGDMMMKGQGPGGMVIDALLKQDPYAAILMGVETVTYGGTQNIGETECHYLKVVQPAMDLELWIAKDKEPWLVRIKPDMSRALLGAYKVEGISQTLIIGKNGVIEAIHVGFMSGMEKKMKKGIDTLLAGKSLLKKK